MQTASLIAPFVGPLERLGFPYMVTGSTAGIIYGEPRMTHDVDIVIEVGRAHRGHCKLIHHDPGFKADIYIAFDDLHRWGLAHRRAVALEGETVHVAPPEYVILRKLEYFREGGSAKHLRDIRSILEVSGDEIDREFLAVQISARHLEAQWAQVTV